MQCTQVELNTISSSFGCLCTLVGQLHQHIMEHQGASEQVLVILNTNLTCLYATVSAMLWECTLCFNHANLPPHLLQASRQRLPYLLCHFGVSYAILIVARNSQNSEVTLNDSAPASQN